MTNGNLVENIQKILTEIFYSHKKIAIMGLGSEIKGDDAVGIYIVEQLKRMIQPLPANLRIINASLMPDNFFYDLISFNVDCLIVIDALYITNRQKDYESLNSDIFVFRTFSFLNESFSTHNISLETYKKLLENKLNKKIHTIFIGIRGYEFEFGSTVLSKKVQENADYLITIFKSIWKKRISSKSEVIKNDFKRS